MNFSGILWKNRQKNECFISHLKEKMLSIFPSLDKVENKFVTLFSVKSGINDEDSIVKTNSSLIMGRIFSKETYKQCKSMEGDNVLLARNFLNNNSWGKYICFLFDEENVEVIRDSVGQIPFYYYLLPTGDIVFSSLISILYDYDPKKFVLNEQLIRNYLLLGDIFTNKNTIFKNVHELPPGSKLILKNEGVFHQTHWDPMQFVDNEISDEKDDYEIVECTLKILKGWVEPYESLVISLSGGLDSTSLLFCLSSIIGPQQKLKAINYYHPLISSSNEILQAKKACEDTNTELMQIDLSNYLPFNVHDKLKFRPNNPHPSVLSSGLRRAISSHLTAGKPSLMINGQGGDHIFLCPPTEYAIADSFVDKGLKYSFQKLKELAVYYRKPFLPILAKNIKAWFNYSVRSQSCKKMVAAVEQADWFSQDLLASNKIFVDFPYKWPKKIYPGKQEHIKSFYLALPSLNNIEHMDYFNPPFSPFLYQPMVELALKIKTYDLYNQDFDRLPLRKAINKYFNTNLVWRKNKGETSGIIQLGLKKYFNDVRSLCLDGYFAKNKLIDVDLFNQDLLRAANGESNHLWYIVNLASMELFLNSWGLN